MLQGAEGVSGLQSPAGCAAMCGFHMGRAGAEGGGGALRACPEAAQKLVAEPGSKGRSMWGGGGGWWAVRGRPSGWGRGLPEGTWMGMGGQRGHSPKSE